MKRRRSPNCLSKRPRCAGLPLVAHLRIWLVLTLLLVFGAGSVSQAGLIPGHTPLLGENVALTYTASDQAAVKAVELGTSSP